MAKRGGKAAGFWMIRRQNQEIIDPDNPHNLPVYVLGGNPVVFGLAFTNTFVLIIL